MYIYYHEVNSWSKHSQIHNPTTTSGSPVFVNYCQQEGDDDLIQPHGKIPVYTLTTYGKSNAPQSFHFTLVSTPSKLRGARERHGSGRENGNTNSLHGTRYKNWRLGT
eukprot:c22738_g1_i1 orf=8-331(-)